jgi:transcription termination factor Rho
MFVLLPSDEECESRPIPASNPRFFMPLPEIIKRNAPGALSAQPHSFRGTGVLEILPDGFGFLRGSEDNYQPGSEDIYVSPSQIRRFDLRTGDVLSGMVRAPKEGERYNALIQVKEVNGADPDTARGTPSFDDLKAIHPSVLLDLAASGDLLGARLVHAFAPIGKGQRVLIVAPPGSGATQLLLELGQAIQAGHADINLMAISVDARPEEVSDLRDLLDGEIASSTFDEAPSRHLQIAEIAIERAKRLVEQGRDVVVLLDSLTQLARAANATLSGSGKVLASGIDAQAISRIKRLFGAARNVEGIGSLTLIATVRSQTGAAMDAHLLEELRCAANCEIHLSQDAASQRIFPALNLLECNTHRSDKLRPSQQEERMAIVRTHLAKNSEDALHTALKVLAGAKSTDEFLDKLPKSGE